MTTTRSPLSQAQSLAAPLPALLAQAQRLANAVLPGEHGRRRGGHGDAFWQFRAAQPFDSARQIDWRRSARSDDSFVQEKEWQTAQSVAFWVDPSDSLQFASLAALPSKSERAQLLCLACAILLDRGGERVGLTSATLPPKRGSAQIYAMAEKMSTQAATGTAPPDLSGLGPRSQLVLASDFLGDLAPVEQAVAKAVSMGVQGVLLQVLDPQEEAFPFEGRTIFESMSGALRHETRKADELRPRYFERLAARKDRLAQIARAAGWQFATHRTDAPPAVMLQWLCQMLGQRQT